MSDGLSFRHATCVVQDNQGYMWIGTRNGLNRFDGYEFVHFTTHSEKGIPSLSGNYIHDLDIDASGNIWIATNSGLDVLDPVNYNIQSYSPQSVFNNKKGIKTIDEITITKESGRIFIHSHQYQRFDRFYNTVEYKNSKFHDLIFSDNSSNQYEYIANVFEDEDKALWARPAYSKTFFKLNDQYKIIESYNLPDSIGDHSLSNVSSPSEAELKNSGPYKRNLEFIRHNSKFELIGSFCDSHETFMIKGNLKEGFSCIHEDIGIEGRHMPINDFVDRDGDLWMMLDETMYVMSGEQANKIPTSQINLSQDAVTYFYQSRDGTIWITTNFGVYRVFKEPNPFKFYLNTKENEKGYGQSIRAIEQASDKICYASVVHDGIWKTNLTSAETEQILGANHDNGSKNYSILPYAMHYNSGMLWLCNWFDEGVLKFDLETGELDHIHCEENLEGFARSMVYDNKTERLWIGTDHGLNILDLKTEVLSRFTPTSNAKFFNQLDFSALLLNDSKEVWLGTRESGLFKLVGNDFSLIANKESGLSDNSILSIYEYGDYLWIGTSSGLNRLDIESGNIVSYTTQHGLPNNHINAITEMNGFIWLSTNKGLCKFNIETESGSSYYKEDGLIHEEFNYSSSRKLDNGNILFGGMNGIIEVSKTRQPTTQSNSKIILTGYEKSDFQESSQLINGADLIKNGIDLYHNDKSFSFKFALLDLFSSKHIKYKYKLEGYDDNWTLIGSENKVRFNKLPPGDYTFRVKALGKNGVWSEHELKIPIRVHQVFYKTWWFISLVVLAVLLLFYTVYRIRVNQIEKMAQLRVKIASDLHDDVGSMLTQIAMQSELVGAKAYNEDEEKEEILKIAKSSREAVNTMSDVVWSIDSRQDKLVDLLDRMKDYAGDALSRAGIEMNFQFEGGSQANQHLKPQFRQNVYLVFKEAINNVVKHSNAEQVDILISSTKQTFKMTIKDNGSLSKNEGRQAGQGLKNMKLRASQIKGELELNTSDGYEITLSV